MNQQIGDEDAQEQELRARIMELRRTIRRLERQQETVIPRELGPLLVAMFYVVGLEELDRERLELDNAEGLYRDTYPNLVERINILEENHEVQEHFIDDDFLDVVMERARLIQQLGEQRLRELLGVPHNPLVPPLENGRIHRPPPPQQLGDQELLLQFLAAERRLQRREAEAEMNAVPANLNEAIPVEHRQNQNEPRQEDQEGPENINPEEPRQEGGPENQGEPELGDQEFIERWNAARRFFERRQNRNEPRQEDQEGPENQEDPVNQPQN